MFGVTAYSASALLIRKLRHSLKGQSLSTVSKEAMTKAAIEGMFLSVDENGAACQIDNSVMYHPASDEDVLRV